MQIQCPGCQKILSAPDAMRGKSACCPACQQVFSLPSLLQADPAGSVADVPTTSVPIYDISLSPEGPPAMEIESAEDVEPVLDEEGYPLQEEPLDVEPEPLPAVTPRRRKRRKKRASRPRASAFAYYTGALGGFPLFAVSMLAVWLVLAVLSLVTPAAAWLLICLGGLLYVSGWFHLMLTAFRDEAFHGRLIFMTHFYWIVYSLINPAECWKPVVVMILGILMSSSGMILLSVLFRLGAKGM